MGGVLYIRRALTGMSLVQWWIDSGAHTSRSVWSNRGSSKFLREKEKKEKKNICKYLNKRNEKRKRNSAAEQMERVERVIVISK